jgi:hypothetical protein
LSESAVVMIVDDRPAGIEATATATYLMFDHRDSWMATLIQAVAGAGRP